MCQAIHILLKQLSKNLSLSLILEVRNISGDVCAFLMVTRVASVPHCSWPDPFPPIVSVSPRVSERWNLTEYLCGFMAFKTERSSVYMLIFIWEI